MLRAGIVRAVVLNSGGANACTGPQGFQDTHATAEYAAARLTAASPRLVVGAADVAVCSTGLIGERLPMPKLLAGIDAAVRGLAPRRRCRRGGGHHDDRHPTQDHDRRRRRMVGRRHGQGSRACSPRPGDHALRAHHRRGRRFSTTLDAVLREATPDDLRPASTPTAASPQTTPCCCSPAAPPGSRPRRRSSPRPSRRRARTSPCNFSLTPRVPRRTSPSRSAPPPARPTPSRSAAPSPGRNLVKTALYGADPNWGRILVRGRHHRAPSSTPTR